MRSLVREKFDLEPDYRWLRTHSEASGVSIAYFLERAKAIRAMSKENHDRKGGDMVTNELTLTMKNLKGNVLLAGVSEISADMAMKTLQLFDDLPPLFQTLTKIIAIATKKAHFKIPSIVVWKVMNDLYGDLDSDRFGVVITEMKEMHLFKVVVDRNMDKIFFASPIVADVAMSTCTPSQIRFISEALLYRLDSMMMHEWKVPLVMADLYHDLRRNEDKKKECWKKAYKAFTRELKEASYVVELERAWWMEYFSDVITLAGYSPTKVLGKDFSAPKTSVERAPEIILELGAYVGPITLGPLGHTLSVLSRNLFQDYGASVREADEEKAEIRKAIAGSRRRYFREVNILERYLRDIGLEEDPDRLADERLLIHDLTSSSLTGDEVLAKAKRFFGELVRDYVFPRLERIRDCVTCVSGIPDVVEECQDEALLLAYKKVVRGKCWKDKTEDALMALAVNNWKPRALPECTSLPVSHRQTICQIRDKFLKQKAVRNGDEISGRQEYLFSDFKAFLIVTSLLYNAMDAENVEFEKPKLMRNRSGDSIASFGSFGSLANKIDHGITPVEVKKDDKVEVKKDELIEKKDGDLEVKKVEETQDQEQAKGDDGVAVTTDNKVEEQKDEHEEQKHFNEECVKPEDEKEDDLTASGDEDEYVMDSDEELDFDPVEEANLLAEVVMLNKKARRMSDVSLKLE